MNKTYKEKLWDYELDVDKKIFNISCVEHGAGFISIEVPINGKVYHLIRERKALDNKKKLLRDAKHSIKRIDAVLSSRNIK